MLAIIAAIVFAGFVIYTIYRSVKVTLWYLLTRITVKQAVIGGIVVALLIGLFGVRLQGTFLGFLGTFAGAIVVISLLVLMWYIILKSWTNAIQSGKQDEFFDKAEGEYSQYKQAKREHNQKRDKELIEALHNMFGENK